MRLGGSGSAVGLRPLGGSRKRASAVMARDLLKVATRRLRLLVELLRFLAHGGREGHARNRNGSDRG